MFDSFQGNDKYNFKGNEKLIKCFNISIFKNICEYKISWEGYTWQYYIISSYPVIQTGH